MAAGDIKYTGNAKKAFCLLAGVVATNGKPTAATDGYPCYPDESKAASGGAASVCYTTKTANEATIFAKGTGTGTVTMTLRMWGYLSALGKWVPIGTGADATKGTLNAGAAVGEDTADVAVHCEPFYLAGHFDRLYCEVTAIGAATTVEVWIVTSRTISF